MPSMRSAEGGVSASDAAGKGGDVAGVVPYMFCLEPQLAQLDETRALGRELRWRACRALGFGVSLYLWFNFLGRFGGWSFCKQKQNMQE